MYSGWSGVKCFLTVKHVKSYLYYILATNEKTLNRNNIMYKLIVILLVAKWAACIVDEVEHNGNPMPVHWYTVNLDDEPRIRCYIYYNILVLVFFICTFVLT